MKDQATRDKERRHLDRLETLIDSIYALVIVILVAQFPSPLDREEEFPNLSAFLRDEGGDLVAPLIGLVLIVIYWLQNNALFGYLERTDNKHASSAIAQMFFVLFYLYTSDLMEAFPDTRTVLAIQSATFAMMGFLAIWGWTYATKGRRLIGEELDDEQIRTTLTKVLPEPLTALVTLVCAPFGTMAWNLGWLAAPVIGVLVRRRR